MQGVVQLFQSEHVAAANHDQHLLVRQPKHLIRREQSSASLALSLTVLRDHLGNGNGLADGHRGFDQHAHIPAAGRKILGRHAVRAAEHKLDIAVADDLGPEVVGIPVLELAEALYGQHDPDVPGADDAQRAGKVRAVRCAADPADIIELIQDKIDRDVAGAAWPAVRIAGQIFEFS